MKDEFEHLLDGGFEKFYVGEWDAAEELYEAARRLRPDSGRPLVLEGRSRLMQGRLQEAREKFLDALNVEPTCVEAYEAFASMFGVFGGDHIFASRCLLYALQLKPERQRTWSLLLRNLEQLGVPAVLNCAAEMACQRAAGETEADLGLRCAIHRALGHREELAEEAKRFIALFPNSRTAEMYGIMAQWAEETDVEHFEEALDEDECDESGWTEAIQQVAESFEVSEEVRREIAHLWERFLDGGITAPEV